MTTSSKEIYGVEASEWATPEYIAALLTKNIFAGRLLDELQSEPIEKRDHYRITQVLKAMNFNDYLISEAKGQ